MIEKLVGMVQDQSYEQILFIMGFGLLVVGAVVATVFGVTRNKKSPSSHN